MIPSSFSRGTRKRSPVGAYFPSHQIERATPRYIRASNKTRRRIRSPFEQPFHPFRWTSTNWTLRLYRLSNQYSVLLRGQIDVELYGAALLAKSINMLLRRRKNFYPLTISAILSQCHIDVVSLSAGTIFAFLQFSSLSPFDE